MRQQPHGHAGEDRRGRSGRRQTGTTDAENYASLVAMTKQYAVAGILTDPDWPQTTVKMRHQQRDGINPPVYESLAAAMQGKPRLDSAPAPTELSS